MTTKKTKKQKTTRKKESKQRVTNRRKKQKKFLPLVITLFLIPLIFLALYIGYCYLTLPNLDEVLSRTRQPSTTIIAENGNEIQSFGQVYSEFVHSYELPQYVIDAIVSTEDRRFYSHFGFDVISFTRAMLTNLFKRRYAQGGSTISQQAAKNLFLTSQKTIHRKVQELLLAFWLEHKFSKEQILTLYLNRVYLGSGTYGIEAAAQKYFQKSSRDLNLKEAAVIAGMLKAPSRYNPIASEQKADERAKIVLKNMLNNHKISEKEYNTALKTPLKPEKSYKVEGAKHFADWVYGETNAYIGERDDDIYVHTTLDQDLQQHAENVLQKMIKTHTKYNVSNGAVVVLDKFGAIKAMVGGINYAQSQFNRATQALRQSGSVFKPFVYLTALQQGYSPDDKINDTPITIENWKPENYDRKYYGEVSLRQALAKSLNLATVNLAEKVSRRKIIKNAKRLGITTPISNSPSLSLGSFEVKVIDIATAYSVFANGGYATWPHAIKEIYTRDGLQIYERKADNENRIISAKDARLLGDMLFEVIEKGTGKIARLPFAASGKTGTTQDYRDAWFVGYTDELICAVWVGNDDNSPMKGITGGTLPAKIWKEIMAQTR